MHIHKHKVTNTHTLKIHALLYPPPSTLHLHPPLTHITGDNQLPLDEVVQVLVNLREILGPPCYLNAEFKVGRFRR